MIDYETLRLIWWALLGILFIGFLLTDGFDLGVATLLPIIGRNDRERQEMIHTIAPVWEGNQVWLILGAGASFAAWPLLYSVAFSGFYFAMFLALFAIILRPVGFKFRDKVHHPLWRQAWDYCLFIGGFIPALVFGIAFGNLFTGASFYFDELMRPYFTGTFLELFTPFSLLCGLMSLAIALTHGASYLCLKMRQPLLERARFWTIVGALSCAVLFIFMGYYLWKYLPGFKIKGDILTNGPSNPLTKTVVREAGEWTRHHERNMLTWIAPLLGLVSLLATIVFTFWKKYGLGFIANCFAIISIMVTAGQSLYPFLLPSRSHPNYSLTIWDSSSSHMTLFVMLLITIIFMPIVLGYISWAYYILRGKPPKQQNNNHY